MLATIFRPSSMITKLAQHLANQVVYLKGKFNEILYRQSLYKQSHQFSHQRRQNEGLESGFILVETTEQFLHFLVKALFCVKCHITVSQKHLYLLISIEK